MSVCVGDRGEIQNLIESRNMISGYRIGKICVRVGSEESLYSALENGV